jgi:hypothetical protein
MPSFPGGGFRFKDALEQHRLVLKIGERGSSVNLAKKSVA